MRFLAYEGGRCKLERLGWFVFKGGSAERPGLFGDLALLCGDEEGDGRGDIVAAMLWIPGLDSSGASLDCKPNPQKAVYAISLWSYNPFDFALR